MTFWQGLAISILAQTTDVGGQDEEEWAKSAQNFLICLEMLLFSIAHFYCFPVSGVGFVSHWLMQSSFRVFGFYANPLCCVIHAPQTDEWQEGYRVKHEQSKFGDSMALGDFFSDVKLILQSKPKKKKKRRGSSSPKSSRKLAAVPEGAHDENNEENVEVSIEGSGGPDVEVGMNGLGSSGTTGSSNSDDEDEDEEYQSSATASSYYENEYSFDDSQAQEDDSDDDSDEERGTLSRRFQGLSKEDRRITKALEKSLGLAADDPDIAEAARRLLDSKVLSPDFFQTEMSDDEDMYKLYGADTKSDDEGFDDDDEETDNEEALSSAGDVFDEDEAGDDVIRSNGVEEKEDSFRKDPEESIHAIDTVEQTPERGDLNTSMEETRHTPVEDGLGSSAEKNSGENLDLLSDDPNMSSPEMSETVSPEGTFDLKVQQSRSGSEGGFWAFESNVPTPAKSPAPLPAPNEGTPLLSRKSPQHDEIEPEVSTTPLRSSIFTTVAALAEESDEEDKTEKFISSANERT